MEPAVGPLSDMDPHDPASISGPSASPPLLNNSLLGELSQGGGLEKGDVEGDSGLPRSLLSRIEPYGNSQRKPRSSAFPSSLTWDSDSEKETFDEEELQHFSNPHGLAAHSPGSPTCGQEQDGIDCGVYQTPEAPKDLLFKKDLASPLERRDQVENDKVGSASNQAGSLFSDTKPKEGYQKQEDERKEEKKKLPERDVYSFPGDSDPESPPPGPWAHCTFIQRRRKKRALLRPFSGLNTWQRTTGANRKTRLIPARTKSRAKVVNDEGGVFEFKEEEDEDEDKVQEAEIGQGQRGDLCQDIFTCVECSIYFKRRAHLREHMREHVPDGGRKGQGGEEGVRRRRAKKTGFECMECGQEFSDRLVLVDHHRRHQEARRKILEEIGKLNEGGTGTEEQANRRKPRRLAAQEPSTTPVCGQFVCLKCNYSSDVPQELADHAKTHTTRAKAGSPRAGSPRAASPKAASPKAASPKAASPKAASPRVASPRDASRSQPRSRKKGQTRSSGTGTSNPANTLPTERYPTRASVHAVEKQPQQPEEPQVDPSQASASDRPPINEGDSIPGSIQDRTDSATPEEPATKPELGPEPDPEPQLELASADPDTDAAAPPEGPSLKEESPAEGSTKAGSVEETVPKPQSPVTVPSNPESSNPAPSNSAPSNTRAAPRRREVAYKSTGKRRSKRVVRDAMGRTRASSRLESKHTESNDAENPIQKTEQTVEQDQKEAAPLPEPEADPQLAKEMEESSAETSDLKPSPPPKTSEETKEESKEEIPPDDTNEECGKDTPAAEATDHADKDDKDDKDKENDGNEEDEDDEEEEDDEDVFSRLLDALTEEEDEEDEEGVSLKSVGRKCPYCPDRFDNGIGLANHIRGHLNRVGVSYNVRHFISPEEVNAIEKKFSYQKKKKKVANFDPSTFSVMRCEFCSAGFDTRAGLSSHARAHLRDFGITNWEVTVSPINVLRELFSKRPDLALSTTLQSDVQKQDPDKEEEEEEPVSGKDEEGGTSDTVPEAPTSPAQPWKEERNDSEPEGGQDEESEAVVKMPLLDSFPSSPRSNSSFSVQPESSAPADEIEPKVSGLHKCDVCSATFETRRGLSSHARSHLRQLGVGVSESSGAPIDLLYQITKERTSDSETPDTPLPCPPAPSPKKSPPSPVPTPAEPEEEPQDIKPPLPLSVLGTIVKVPPSPSSPSLGGSLPPSPFGKSRSPSPSPVLRKAPISSLLPVSSPLRSQEHKAMCRVQTSASLSTPPRPFWAPQDSDAPLNLTMEMDPDKDITCKLCGAWFETRKGLSSHARAHLRHFGVEYSESKGSPIDLLNRLILTDDFKHRVGTLLPESPEDLRVRGPAVAPPSPSVSTPTSSASKRPLLPSSLLFKTAALSSGVGPKATSSSSSSSAAHALLAPPTKKLKPSPQHVFRLSGRELMPIPLQPMKDVGCEFCGELFENRKGLSSHARSHLRQLGITEWSVNGSPIDTLRELIARRGLPCVTPLKPIKLQKPLKPLKSPSSSPGLGPPRASLQSSTPQSGLLGRLPFSFTHPPGQHQPTARKQPPSASATSPSPTLVLVKPKPEPEPVEVTITEAGMEGCDGYGSEPLHCSSWSSSGNVHPINLVIAQEKEPSRDIRCEFCGEFFENRKGLSSHARSHLRHMGITEWSVNGSPIDTLWEIMRKQGTTPASVALGVKEEPGRDGSPSWDTQAYQSPKVSRKSPLNLLHSGSRLHKHGLATTGLSATPPAGKFFGMAPVGKRVVGSEGHLGERSQSFKSKTFSPPPPPSTQDFSYKAKASTDKHGVGHMDASCELCGFFFENRKALASHARAHLRQFGVTEWCVNGSPIETLSAWMRSRPQTVAELHRTYLQGGRSVQKKVHKRSRSSLSPSSDSDLMAPLSQKSSGAPWSSLALSQGRAVRRDALNSSWGSSQAANVKIGTGASSRHGISTQGRGHHSNSSLPHVQVARSELNVRVPRGIERRPLKHPSHADGGEKESCPPKPPRSSTVPALVPKPPSTPLVKLVGKIYSLKCRFCDVEFHGPLSVQEDWIRHLQQHILNLNYNKPAPTATNTPTKPETAAPQTQASATTSSSSSSTTTTTTTTNNNTAPTPTTPAPANTPTPTSTAPPPLASPGTPPTAEPLRAPAT
ncbi:protein Wiz isoform X2 [Astyanax mexicanus]|uniref:protein Wiz isoform X2 n=1 Tax=Astyanax mexicanus TaxID=7994 RepID=UPI0020CAE014|nr:protein Wiz isoform X2 [Astyanax mexicanus]